MSKSNFRLLLLNILLMLTFAGSGNMVQARESASLAEPFDVSNSPAGNFTAALIAEHEHDTLAASTFFREALRYDPKNYDLMDHAFIASLANGDMDAGFDLAARIVRHDPGNGLGQLVLGVQNLKKRRFISARGNFARIQTKSPHDLVVTLLSAWSMAGSNNTRDALALLAQLPSDNFGVLRDFHAGLIAQLGKNPVEAEKDLAGAYNGAKATLRVVDAYGRLLDQQGKLQDALAIYTEFGKLAPHNPVVENLIAQLNSGQHLGPLVGNAQQGAAEALYGLGVLGIGQADNTIATIYLRLALTLMPDNSLAQITLADLYGRNKQYASAVEIYDSVAKSDPLRINADVQTALTFDAADRKDEAIKQITNVLSAHPNDREALVALGDLQRSHKDFAGAADTFSKIIALEPNPTRADWVTYYSRGVSYAESKEWTKAEADFKQALQLSPDQPAVLNYLGYSWIDRGENLDDAFVMLRKAVDLRPNDAYIIDSLGWAYFKLGRYKEALQELEKAVSLKPADPVVNEHLGDAYWRADRHLDASFQWNHARDLKPEAADLPRILEKIKNGMADPVPAQAGASAEKKG